MAQQIFNSLGRVGIGLALGASVVNSALYNGKLVMFFFRPFFFEDDRLFSIVFVTVIVKCSNILFLCISQFLFWLGIVNS